MHQYVPMHCEQTLSRAVPQELGLVEKGKVYVKGLLET
jgi:hypothetical protein